MIRKRPAEERGHAGVGAELVEERLPHLIPQPAAGLGRPPLSLLAARLPAVVDLLEWGPGHTAIEQFSVVMNRELSVDGIISLAPAVAALSDDRPVNEYYWLRRLGQR